ncbi:hypothetical protein D9M68_839860 [compost metagenome]
MVVLGQPIEIAHGKGRQHERHVDDHVPHQLVIRDVLGVHEHLEQVNRRNRHDGRCDFHLQRAGVHLAQPTELFLAVVDIQLGNEVLVAGNHHHHQQAADQGHVDQRQDHQDQIGLGHGEHAGQNMKDFLKELHRQRQQP